MRLKQRATTVLLCVTCVGASFAQSNFDPEHSVSSALTIGLLDWAVPQHGAAINQYYASGYIYGANVGWISLGSAPADRLQYRNNSATDFGVNVTPDGALRGYAYGANIGWINFEPTGNPRIDWTSGRLAGRIWSANVGWIDLESSTEYLRLDSLPAPADSDNDSIADAWEIAHASNLTSLSATSDADADGMTDLGEFLAGTDPYDRNDSLLLQVTVSSTSAGSNLSFQTKTGYVYVLDQRSAFESSAAWSPLGEKIVGTGSVANVTVPFSDGYTFYRIRAFPPLSEPEA